jgi:hypothetical protein
MDPKGTEHSLHRNSISLHHDDLEGSPRATDMSSKSQEEESLLPSVGLRPSTKGITFADKQLRVIKGLVLCSLWMAIGMFDSEEILLSNHSAQGVRSTYLDVILLQDQL